MGCGGSSAQVDPPPDHGAQGAPPDDAVVRKSSNDSLSTPTKNASKISLISQSSGRRMTEEENLRIHERLKKLKELDEATKIPFILIELRGLGHQDGCIEICGKDEYGVYDALHNFFTEQWGCNQEDPGSLELDTPIPFCDAMYKWTGFLCSGDEGMSNMGLASMRLVHFMCQQLTWTLGVVNGGNVGEAGEIREQQIIFKAPHPMNMVARHIMIELRSAGYIEVCGDDAEVIGKLDGYFKQEFQAEELSDHEQFCDKCYRTGPGAFRERGSKGENNLGRLTVMVCDAMVEMCPGWSITTLNGGNYGDEGNHREQQLVFRWDTHPLGANPHMIVELRDAGFVEVNGRDEGDIYKILDSWLKREWGCKEPKIEEVPNRFYDRKYPWKPKDMLEATGEIVGFFHTQGWQMQVCSQGTVKVRGDEDSREQQILFRPGASGLGILEPHMFIELYTGEGVPELYENANETQILGNQFIRVLPIGDCSEALKDLGTFISKDLGGKPDTGMYICDLFLARGQTDNNLGCWTMRMCDFMVDRLGWSFVVCNVCNMGPFGHFREQQLVFRWDGERREIPVVRQDSKILDLDTMQDVQLPPYWSIPETLSFQKHQAVVSCDRAEIDALQEIFDHTFKRVLTRDRVYEYQNSSNEEMPFRLVAVHAFRSENLSMWQRYSERLAEYPGGTPCPAKTRQVGKHINARLGDGESLLFHGTNPSSAMAILKTGFVLSHSGKSTGTMFGYGVYLAEAVSKSDEYARDDGGGTFPQQLAMLVCRSLIGNPHIVHDPGQYVDQAKEAGCDCICGDRETKVNTYKEFVFFDERQVMPEYVVIYRREYDKRRVPETMRQPTKGTTGRSWQVKLDKGYINVAPNVNMQLLLGMQRRETIIEVPVGEFQYVFDLANKTQTNKNTGMVRQLRAPMRVDTALPRGASGLVGGGSSKSLG